MIEGKLSRRYARAVFELASGREEAVGAEIDGFLKAYEDPDLRKVLGNPAFDQDRRKDIVVEVAGRLGLSDLTANFLSLLVTRDRLDGSALHRAPLPQPAGRRRGTGERQGRRVPGHGGRGSVRALRRWSAG